MCYVKVKVLEGAFEYVVGEEGTEVTDVCVVVDGWSAGVHGDLVGGLGGEGLFGAGEGVVEFDFGACWGCVFVGGGC